MKTLGFDRPLYTLPFDHRGSFQTTMFGWKGMLTSEQTAALAATKQVIYEGFKAAVAAGVPKEKAGILVDEQFGAAILRDAAAQMIDEIRPGCDLEVDGGIDVTTAPLVVSAGANVLVAGSAIFGEGDGVVSQPCSVFAQLRIRQ